MGKSRHSIESGGGGKPVKKNSRDKRAGLMDGMRGGSPTKDEIARVIVSVPEIVSTSKPEEIEPVPAPETTTAAADSGPIVANEDSPLDTETLDQESMEEMRELLAKGEIGIAASAKSAPTSPEDIYGDREVPKSVAEIFAKLKGKVKREDYLKKVAADEEEKAAKRQKREPHRKSKGPKTKEKSATEKNDSPSAYSGKLAELENAYHARYPDGRNIPEEVSEKYFALTKAGMGTMFSSDKEAAAKAAETEAEVEALINELSLPTMPIVPQPISEIQPPAQVAEVKPPQVEEPEVDASEFAAPQYASRDMQAEVDALNESKPEPEPVLPTIEESEPNVFRKNRERAIPTLTDVVELPGQQIGREAENQAPESRPFSVGTEIRDDGMEYVSIMPGSLSGEGTPKEWRARLREAVGKFVGGVKEKVEWWKSAEEGLVRRSDELNTVAEKISGGEKLFRKMGEKYNKLHWGYKLAVGAGLGVGYGAALSTVSIPAIVGCILGIGAQRTLGLATMYLKYEKTRPYGDRNQGGFWNCGGSREKAMMKSMLYTAAMTTGMAYMAKEISDNDLVNRTKEWLGNMMDKFVGNHPEAGAVATASSVLPEKVQIKSDGAPLEQPVPVPQSIPSPEVSQPAVAATAGEAAEKAGEAAAPTAVAVEMPSVEAKAGDGYERMLKNLWEQTKGTTYPEGSDMARLQGIDPKNLGAEIHRLATDNEFFKANGESVRINIGDKLAVDSNGDIWLNDQTILAPEGAPTTPAPSPEVPTVVEKQHAWQERIVPEDTSPSALDDMEKKNFEAPVGQAAPAPEALSAVEPPPAESVAPAPVIEKSIITNTFGLPVSVAEPHIYADVGAKHLFVYGGSPAEIKETILKYLTENPTKVVFAADESGKFRLPWHLVNGEMTPGAPIRTNGFLGFGSTWMKPPGPDEFEKIIK